jgi:hypothetical protein
MRKIFFIMCFLFIFQSFAYSDVLNPDSNAWNSWNLEGKNNYLIGFVNGSHSACLTIGREVFLDRGKEIDESLMKHLFYYLTPKQLRDGLDILYADFKNRIIFVGFGIHIVKKQIKGTPPEDIEKILLWLRAGGKGENKSYYLAIKDNEGKVIRMIEFP